MAFTELDMHLMIKRLKTHIARMKEPEPGPYWQYSEWVQTMQTILELESILDTWNHQGKHDKQHG